MDIYWIKDKRQCGPSTVPDVISLLQVGELTPDSLGWHTGCPKWLPLRELPALADFLSERRNAPSPADEEASEFPEPKLEDAPPTPLPAEAPATPAIAEIAADREADPLPESAEQRIYLPSPVARLLARFVDYGLYTMLFYTALYLRNVPYDARLLLSVNPLLWLPMVVIEAALLSTWGTTPGKALMSIRITTFRDVPRLSFLRAFMRSLMAFTIGMGVMIPQILPLMLAFEYWMLRRRGITPWDARCSTLPTQKVPVQPSRYVLAIITLYICAIIAASCVQPWFRDMVADIEKGSPELARTLRQYLPEEQPATEPTPTPAPPIAPAPMDTSLPGI